MDGRERDAAQSTVHQPLWRCSRLWILRSFSLQRSFAAATAFILSPSSTWRFDWEEEGLKGRRVVGKTGAVAGKRRMLIRCRPRRRHQKGLASGLVTSYENVLPPASPLFECAIVGIRDDDERNFFRSTVERRRLDVGGWYEKQSQFGVKRRGTLSIERSTNRSGEPRILGMSNDLFQRVLLIRDLQWWDLARESLSMKFWRSGNCC